MIPIPCQRNCCLDQQDICLGCGRALHEITGWHQACDETKLQILANAQSRLHSRHQINVLTPAEMLGVPRQSNLNNSD